MRQLSQRCAPHVDETQVSQVLLGICVSHSPSSVHASQPPAAQAVETCRPSIQAPALVTAFSPTAAIYNPTLGHACPRRVRRCPDMSDLRVLNEERRLHCSCPVKSAGLPLDPDSGQKSRIRGGGEMASSPPHTISIQIVASRELLVIT